jgi:dGTPase
MARRLDKWHAGRAERFHAAPQKPGPEARSGFQRDRDRILYCGFFRRLALITQVVSPDEGYRVHNRLTHVLKVAQMGRRLAEKLLKQHDEDLVPSLGGLDPEVVEAACLAHDLGHPPFGHVAEKVLDEVATSKYKSLGGFEGNAQSFRVVTKLEQRYAAFPGLNLTRATLCALLKYPWKRSPKGKKKRKWGAYESESEEFEWARDGLKEDCRTLEAELMDWADDIAYSVHDMEDFFRSGRIPLHLLRSADERERGKLIDGIQRRTKEWKDAFDRNECEATADRIFRKIPVTRPYDRSREHDMALAMFSSELLNRFDNATRLNASGLEIDPMVRAEVDLLKQLTWQYVIDESALASQQLGQRKVIETLVDAFCEDALSEKSRYHLFPAQDRILLGNFSEDEDRVRVAIDLIAGLTEQQAIILYHRISGVSLGSVFGLDM